MYLAFWGCRRKTNGCSELKLCLDWLDSKHQSKLFCVIYAWCLHFCLTSVFSRSPVWVLHALINRHQPQQLQLVHFVKWTVQEPYKQVWCAKWKLAPCVCHRNVKCVFSWCSWQNLCEFYWFRKSSFCHNYTPVQRGHNYRRYSFEVIASGLIPFRDLFSDCCSLTSEYRCFPRSFRPKCPAMLETRLPRIRCISVFTEKHQRRQTISALWPQSVHWMDEGGVERRSRIQKTKIRIPSGAQEQCVSCLESKMLCWLAIGVLNPRVYTHAQEWSPYAR